MGLPANHLQAVAEEQGFILAPCIYDFRTQSNLAQSLIEHHLSFYESQRAVDPSEEPFYAHAAWKSLAADVAQYGPMVKDESFAEEHEWRLISKPQTSNENLHFRSGRTGLVLYLRFELLTSENPSMSGSQPGEGLGTIVGPSVDRTAQSMAVQFLLQKEFGGGCWHGATTSTYK